MKRQKAKALKNLKKFLPFLVIALVALSTVAIFFSSGYPDGHDLGYHAASVAGMSQRNFFEILTSKIYGVVANDLGYGEGLFYPPLAHVACALIYKAIAPLGLSVFTALKIFHVLVLFFAGVFMYQFMLLLTKNRKAALLSSCFYLTTPYFLTDILIRGAMAECTIFVFMPLVLTGLYYLLHDQHRKFLLCFTIGVLGLVHSHLMLTMFFVILALLGFLPNLKLFFQKKRFLYVCLSAVLTVLISLPFLLPMLENKLNTDYHVFEPGFMTSVERIQDHSVPPETLFSLDGALDNVTGFLSFFSVAIVAYAIFRFRKISTPDTRPFLLFAVVISVVSMIGATTLFPWKDLPEPFLLIQFPWRLCSFVVLGGAIALGLVLPTFEKKSGDLAYFLVAVACCFNIFQINSFAPSVKDFDQNALYAHPTYDYLPVMIPNNLDYVLSLPKVPVADDKNVEITNVESNVPDLSFSVSGVEGPTKIVIPRYYYLGYSIDAYFADGVAYDLPYELSEEGMIEFTLDQDASIVIDYPGTPLQRAAYTVSGLTILGCGAYMVIYKLRKNH